MTTAAKKNGAKIQVWLSSSECEEWATDEAFRVTTKQRMQELARSRGRKFAEAFDTKGKSLALVQA